MPKQDIRERADIELLVNSFYEKVRQSQVIGFIFDEVAQIDWDKHLPRMYSFWASLLLDEHSYQGNPMIKHLELSKQTAMTDEQFSEWLLLFRQTLDELFEGPIAEDAKIRAANIARLMLFKIQSL